jgi:polyisoprenyl-phosphate glycosyltransferase
VFNEQQSITVLLDSIKGYLTDVGVDYEVIIVDDGSSDDTWPTLQALTKTYANLSLVQLSRNFGKEAAIMAGFHHCNGDAAILLDADLQHPPSLIKQMIHCWRTMSVDIVDGVKRSQGPGSVTRGWSSTLFAKLFQTITGYDLSGASDFKLLDRKVIEAINELQDYNLFFRGTTLWLGFNHHQVFFDTDERSHGHSRWSFLSRLRLAITAITSFTALPLQLITLVGILSSFFALLLGIQTLYHKFMGNAVEGFTTVIILLLFFGSVITLGLGIIGAYLSKIHDEVRNRPRYLVSKYIKNRATKSD